LREQQWPRLGDPVCLSSLALLLRFVSKASASIRGAFLVCSLTESPKSSVTVELSIPHAQSHLDEATDIMHTSEVMAPDRLPSSFGLLQCNIQ